MFIILIVLRTPATTPEVIANVNTCTANIKIIFQNFIFYKLKESLFRLSITNYLRTHTIFQVS